MDIQELREELHGLEMLEKTPAFLVLVATLQAEIDEMQRALVLTPTMNLDSCLHQEYRKGQIEGRMAMARFVEDRKEALRYEIDQLKEMTSE